MKLTHVKLCLVGQVRKRLQETAIALEMPVCRAECGCLRKGRWRRQNTAYVNDRLNWVFACEACFEGIQAQWAYQWREYHASRF